MNHGNLWFRHLCLQTVIQTVDTNLNTCYNWVCVCIEMFHKCAKESMLANLLMAKKAPLVGLFEQVNSRKQSVQPHSNNWAIDVEHSNITTQRSLYEMSIQFILLRVHSDSRWLLADVQMQQTYHLNWQFTVTWKPSVFFSTFIHTLISKGSTYMDDLPTLLIIVLRVACYLAVIVQPTSVCPLYK